MYSPELIDHFEHPRNAGVLDSPDISVVAENPACGDVMKLMLKLDAEGRIEVSRYQVRGCVASIACGSAMTELLRGKSRAQAEAIRREQIITAVGGLANESLHAGHLAMDCLRAALKSWSKK